MDNSKIKDNKQLVLDYLQKHYRETGRDFYFKSKHLKLPIDNRVKGRLLKQLVTDGKIRIWSTLPTAHELTFVTDFKNNGMD